MSEAMFKDTSSFVLFLQFGVFMLCLFVAVGKSWYAVPNSEGKMDVSN